MNHENKKIKKLKNLAARAQEIGVKAEELELITNEKKSPICEKCFSQPECKEKIDQICKEFEVVFDSKRPINAIQMLKELSCYNELICQYKGANNQNFEQEDTEEREAFDTEEVGRSQSDWKCKYDETIRNTEKLEEELRTANKRITSLTSNVLREHKAAVGEIAKGVKEKYGKQLGDLKKNSKRWKYILWFCIFILALVTVVPHRMLPQIHFSVEGHVTEFLGQFDKTSDTVLKISGDGTTKINLSDANNILALNKNFEKHKTIGNLYTIQTIGALLPRVGFFGVVITMIIYSLNRQFSNYRLIRSIRHKLGVISHSEELLAALGFMQFVLTSKPDESQKWMQQHYANVLLRILDAYISENGDADLGNNGLIATTNISGVAMS